MSTTYQNQTINLTDVIAPSFYSVHWDILEGKHTYYDLFGGRGSTKSSFIGTEIPLGMMNDAENGIYSNAVVFRKVAATLRESVYEQIQWGIDALGVTELWESRLSPMQFIYKPTGQKIIFRGLDKAKKTKSIKTSKGYFKYLCCLYGSRSWTNLQVLKKYVLFNSLFFVAAANSSYSKASIHLSAAAAGRMYMCRSPEGTV